MPDDDRGPAPRFGCTAAGYKLDNYGELKRVLGQISGNVEIERDMAQEAVSEYLYFRLPDLAVLYPRHRFGFEPDPKNTLQPGKVVIDPPLLGYAEFGRMFKYIRFIQRARRLKLNLTPGRLLAEHLDHVAMRLQQFHARQPFRIAPRGIEAADPKRVRQILDRVAHVMDVEPVPVPMVVNQRPWIKANESERRQMLRDCGWL